MPKARQVLLANRRIVVKEGRSFPKAFCAAQSPTVRGTAPYIVISELPVSRDVRIQATADGAKVIGFLPNNALLVEADAQALKNLEEDVLFMAAVEYEPTDKIQRALLDAKPGESVEATIVLLNEADRATVQSFITAEGGKMVAGTPTAGKAIMAEVPSSVLTKLAGKAEVKWIEKHGRLKPLADVVVKPGLMNVTPVREVPFGLTGDGQIISTTDSGIDTGVRATLHEDLRAAILGMEVVEECRDKDVTGHGTHTAGLLVGSGEKSGSQFRGVAYGAKLWAWFCLGTDGYIHLPDAWDDVFRPDGTDAHIHSGSWGGGDFGVYSEFCAEIDDYVWHHQDFLPVFAAGNEGVGAIQQPATSKNCLSVGASESYRPELKNDEKQYYAENPEKLASFSACGPCDDERIKPDIVAPGTYVLSCLSSCASRDYQWNKGAERYDYYQYMGGTSMATPLVAGSAALVREWLAKYRCMTRPSAALVKAILTGGTNGKDLPNNDFGWGRADVGESVAPTNGLAVYMKDWLPFDAGTNFVVTVTTTNAASLRAQLVWIDYPGASNAGAALVNNLDLLVSSVTNGVEALWYGNGGNAPDELNTVESVRIENATPGRYIVKVSCSKIPYDYTEGGAAAVYIRGAFDPKDVVEGPSPLLYYITQATTF